MLVRELLEILNGVDPDLEVMVAANTLGEILAVAPSKVAKMQNHTGVWPYAVEAAWDKLKVDPSTTKTVLVIHKN